jgi:hypothetical protein
MDNCPCVYVLYLNFFKINVFVHLRFIKKMITLNSGFNSEAKNVLHLIQYYHNTEYHLIRHTCHGIVVLRLIT